MANGIQLIPGSQRNAFVAQGINNYLAGILQQAQQKQFAQDLPTILAIAQKAQSGQQILPQEFANIKSPQALQILSSSLTRSAMTPLQEAQKEYYLSRAKQPPSPQTRVVGDELYERDPTTQQWTPTGIKAAPTPSEQIGQERVSIISKLKPKIETGTATAEEKATYEDAVLGRPISVKIGATEPPSPSERTAIAQTQASIDALNNLKQLFDSSRTKTGPITGRISPLAGLIGMTTKEQESFMAATSAFKNAIIKEITGAQLSQEEAERIMKQIPDITDPEPRWLAKWEESKKNLESLQKRRAEILKESGVKVPEIKEQVPNDPLGIR